MGLLQHRQRVPVLIFRLDGLRLLPLLLEALQLRQVAPVSPSPPPVLVLREGAVLVLLCR